MAHFKKKKGLTTFKNSEKLFIFGMLVYPIIQFIIFYIILNGNSILLSFKRFESNGTYSFVGFDNFKTAINDLLHMPLLKQASYNSLIYFLVALLIGFPLNILFSYFVYKRIPFYKTMRFVLFLPSIISSMVLSLIFKMFCDIAIPNILDMIGIENGIRVNLLGNPGTTFTTLLFYSVWTGFATGVILYSGTMARIPEEIIEAGKMDGIGMLREIFNIVIPMIWPTITIMLVMQISGFFTNMGPAYAMWGSSASIDVQTIGYYLFVTVIGEEASVAGYPYASALGIVLTLIIAPITLLSKYLFEKHGPNVDF